MKLDSRIKSLPDVLTGFGIEKAKEFLGEKGYFAGDLYCFTDLVRSCPYGTLANILDDMDDTFQRGEDSIYYPYFIPECSLKPKEKRGMITLENYKDHRPKKISFMGVNWQDDLELLDEIIGGETLENEAAAIMAKYADREFYMLEIENYRDELEYVFFIRV